MTIRSQTLTLERHQDPPQSLPTPPVQASPAPHLAEMGAGEPKEKETWRARWRRMTRPPRRLTFTRAGKFFMLLTLAVGLGALNTGNNLLFLLLGMMLSAIIASGILSEGVLRKLWVERRAPQRMFAGQPALGAYRVHNPRGYLSLNIEVCEDEVRAVAGPRAGEVFGPKDIPFWRFWVSDAFDELEQYVAIGRAGQIDAGERAELPTRFVLPVRGRYEAKGMRLATRFPFGLFHKIVEVPVPAELIVFPSPAPAQDWLAEVAARFGDINRNRAGMGEEYFGLREWREGEDQRRVHWKRSARRGTLVVREFEEQEQRAVEVVVVHAASAAELSLPIARIRFERALSKTAGLLGELTRMQYRVGLCTLDGRITPRAGEAHLDLMLGQLATLELLRAEAAPWHALAPPELGAGMGGPRGGNMLARVGVGTHAALQACGQSFDLALAVDELEVTS